MKLILVRHGETEANQRCINQGHTCWGLAETGKEQAKRVGNRLRSEPLDIIYVSDLQRTRETAEEITKHHPGVAVVYEPRIREINLGVFEGEPYGTVQKAAAAAGIDPLEFQPEGGESLLQFRTRIQEFFTELREKHEDEAVLLVTHGGFIKLLVMDVARVPREKHTDYNVQNTSVSVIECSDASIALFNCTKHLD